MNERADVVIVGGGAAGLMAAIWAATTRQERRVVVLDGAKTLGSKILVAGGGRCNVTHDVVTEQDFSGSSRHAIKKVIRRFGVEETTRFFEDMGVSLKREATGKLFPVADDGRVVLNALLTRARENGVELRHPCRVTSVVYKKRDANAGPPNDDVLVNAVFEVVGAWGTLVCDRLVLATGGMSLPKSGSDGGGYELARSLGHSITERVFPALVPLVLEAGHFLRSLSGVSLNAELQVRSATGKKLMSFTDSMLCTHFGLSGPSVLDISRHYIDASDSNAGCVLVANWLPGETFESLEKRLVGAPSASVGSIFRESLPARFLEAIGASAQVDLGVKCGSLNREVRRAFVRALVEMPLPVTGNRGFTYAEVTAGGVPLDELHLETMESRRCPGLFMCGEICDVDGRIGGYNFQWAWSSGYTAGVSV